MQSKICTGSTQHTCWACKSPWQSRLFPAATRAAKRAASRSTNAATYARTRARVASGKISGPSASVWAKFSSQFRRIVSRPPSASISPPVSASA